METNFQSAFANSIFALLSGRVNVVVDELVVTSTHLCVCNCGQQYESHNGTNLVVECLFIHGFVAN